MKKIIPFILLFLCSDAFAGTTLVKRFPSDTPVVVLPASGTITGGNCLKSDAGGNNIVDAGVTCGGNITNNPGGNTNAVQYRTAVPDFGGVALNTSAINEALVQVSSGTPSFKQLQAADLKDGTTGTGLIVEQTTPTLTTPVLGVATATSVNKVAITAPATSATLTITDGGTLTAPTGSSNSVVPDTGAANNFLTAISSAGVISKAQPSSSNLSDNASIVKTTRTISTTSPIAGGGDLSADRTISIANAAANGTTLGAAAFTAADFNDNGSGVISIDYTNAQKATSSQPGLATANQTQSSFGVSVDGGGSTITTGQKGYVTVPFACTISAWNITADGSGPTVTFDIWKVATGTALPTVANTIMGTKPALSSGNAIHSTTLTNWTTSVAANDILGFNIDAVTVATKINFVVQCNKT